MHIDPIRPFLRQVSSAYSPATELFPGNQLAECASTVKTMTLKVQGYTALGQLDAEFAAGSEAEREQMLSRLDAQQAVDRVKAAERGRSPRGSLRNGNQPGDPSVAPRCGARAKTRGGKPCRAPAMPNGRCRLHGGLS